MTEYFYNSKSYLTQVYQHYTEQTGQVRMDLNYLLSCENEIDKGSVTTESAMNLFWSFYNPWTINLYTSSSSISGDTPPTLDSNELKAAVNILRRIEEATRVLYEPDADTPSDSLFTYLHIAACYAIQLIKLDGYSEEVRSTLEKAWQATCWYEGPNEVDYCSLVMDNDQIRSFAAVKGLISIDLARICRLDADYEKSLHLLAIALTYIEHVAVSAEIEPLQHILPEFIIWESTPIIDIDFQEFVDVFEHLRTSISPKDWSQISMDCSLIATCWEFCYGSIYETVLDIDGQKIPIDAFWQSAKGWAQARGQPTEFFEIMKREEARNSEQRLRLYFFNDKMWNAMSERAKRSLIDAESAWFSKQHGRPERIFDALLITASEILYSFLWSPLREWISHIGPGNRHFLDSQPIFDNVREGQYPSFQSYEVLLRTSDLRAFLKILPLSVEDIKFLTAILPSKLKKLRHQRNPAEHQIGYATRRELLPPIARDFLGIGCRGILPQLLEIQIKVNTTK